MALWLIARDSNGRCVAACAARGAATPDLDALDEVVFRRELGEILESHFASQRWLRLRDGSWHVYGVHNQKLGSVAASTERPLDAV